MERHRASRQQRGALLGGAAQALRWPGGGPSGVVLLGTALALVASLAGGCRREPADPPPSQPPPPGSWQPVPAPVAPPPTTPPTAQPAPYAPPCEIPEGTCAWARCDMTVKRCKWPCGNDADCVAGARCFGPPGLSQCVGGSTPPR